MLPDQDQNLHLILGSASPRRAELLRQLGFRFTVCPADIDERVQEGELPAQYVGRMAREKAARIAAQSQPPCCVLGADTAVVIDKRILGKPADREEAIAMLQLLADNTHEVLSGVAVTDGRRLREVLVTTRVSFGPISRAAAEAYWHTGEPCDKAGGYGIQGLGAVFVSAIEGSYSGVVGLPLYETAALLRKFGLVPFGGAANNATS